jgi:hypothetical protein
LLQFSHDRPQQLEQRAASRRDSPCRHTTVSC